MRETEAGRPRAARKYLPAWRVAVWGLAGSPSRKFHRLEELWGCGEQSGAGAGAGLEHSLSGEEELPRCDVQERAESGRPTGWAAGCS